MGADTAKVETIRKTIAERGIEFIFAQFVDMYGRPSAKLIPAAQLHALVEDGAGFAGFAAGEIGQLPSDPDIAAIPDLDSFTLVPWQPNLARFACDVTVEGEAWPYCPRTILRNVLAQAAKEGYEFKIGIELEYFLVQLNADGTIEIADKLDTLEKPCYDMAGLTRQYDFLTTVSRYCNELGWGNYANDHEDANGQFEQNFEYDDALVSCDRAIFFRYMVHTLAEQYGRIATFMPKPFTTLTGNGCHFHMSLWKDGDERVPRRIRSAWARALRVRVPFHRRAEDARASVQRPDRADRQLVQAPEARLDVERRHLVAGLDLVRLQQSHPDAEDPGARSHRGSHGRRLLQPVSGGGGGPGLGPRRDCKRARRRRAELGEPLQLLPTRSSPARGLRSLPSKLHEATAELEQDDVLRAALGRTRENEEYVDYYLRVKREEWFRYHEQVSAWEVREYLTRF